MKTLYLMSIIVIAITANYSFGQSPGGVGTTNLTAWFKADAGSGATNTGDIVAQWNDNSPTAAHVTQATNSRRPIFNSNNINYNPSISFDGVNDYMSNNLGSNSYTSEFTMFAEVRLRTLNPEGAYFHNRLTQSGNIDLTSFQLDSDGASYRYRNGSASLFGAFNNSPRLFSFVNQNVGANTRVKTYDLGLETDLTIYTGNNRAQGFKYYEMGTNRIRSAFSNNSSAEFIVFSEVLSVTDRVKVESYLAIKYGHTLDNSLGGITGDYLATTGATIWDASNEPSYHNNVIGIGRENSQALFQKQSHTLFDTTRIYRGNLAVSNTANTVNIGNFSYIMIGDNQGKMHNTTASFAEIPAGCGLYSRLEREWKLKRTSFGSLFNIDITINPFTAPTLINPAELSLLVDDDGDFSNGGTACYSNSDGSGIVITYSNPVITVSNISNVMIPNNTRRYITIGSIDVNTPLPIELDDFDISCQNKTATLSWSTVSELNNDYFTIERSRDGVNFESIATVDGKGTTTTRQHYLWTDEDNDSGTSYYRLSQVDTDGAMGIISTRSINCSKDLNISIFPNPFENEMHVITQLEGLIVLIDVTGKIILEKKLHAGENIIQTKDLASGVYFVNFQTLDGELNTIKLINK